MKGKRSSQTDFQRVFYYRKFLHQKTMLIQIQLSIIILEIIQY